LAIASKGLYATGVSTDINISYISGVKQGEKITVEARVDKLGKTLAFTTVEMFSNNRLGKYLLYILHIPLFSDCITTSCFG
jgi:acyl-coenzyme A thioesterase 13